MEIILLMCMYGITFAIQHKIPGLFNKESYKELTLNKFIKKLLICTFCTGFHAGWLVYLLSVGAGSPFNVFNMLIFAFAGAAFSYTIDTYVQKLEESGNADINEE